MLSVVVFKWDPLPDQREFIPTQIGSSKVSYSSDHIKIHYNMIKRNLDLKFRYILITDQFFGDLNVEIKQFALWDRHRKLGGCYHRLYTFSQQFTDIVGDRFISMDLDMVIVGNITDLISRNEPFVYYKMRGSDGTGWRMNNSMYMMDTGARKFVWEKFDTETETVINNRRLPGTDQGVTNALLDLKNEAHWTQGKFIYDMRQDFLETGRKDLPEDAKIVMFPGPRDPSHENLKQNYPWIEDHYR